MSPSPVWCEGTLLHAVQLSGLFPDCKTFVDMPLKYDADVTLAKWNALLALAPITNDVLALFLRENFDEPEGELEECAPTDWLPMTDQFGDILDEDYKKFAAALHAKWPTLYRKISKKVRVNPEKYSIIPVPNPFVVPGGRFREMYYWDSFFTIKGLIASGMLTTVRGMIENMIYLVETYGFIPNGIRIYYLNRSQPPLLTWCVKAYYEATGDVEFVRDALPTLRKELEFFQTHKSFKRDEWISPLYRFVVETTRPRPESYREDLESAEHLDSFEKKCVLWGDLAAAAESGRDFSSRFFAVHGPYAGQLASTRTSQLIPVDLNSIICSNMKTLSEMYVICGETELAQQFYNEHRMLRATIRQVLWNEEHNCWFDFDLEEDKHAVSFHDTNFFPMYCDSYHEDLDSQAIVDYLTTSGVVSFPGGIPVSLVNSGEQWDFPNCWPPTTWVLLEGLRKVGQEDLALSLVEKWVQKNFNMWRTSGGRMFEKYNAVSPCYKVKGGGEYVMQEGFGWTNGVVLDFLKNYGSQIRWKVAESCECCDVTLSRTLIKPTSPAPSSSSTARLFASDLTQTPSVVSLQSMLSDKKLSKSKNQPSSSSNGSSSAPPKKEVRKPFTKAPTPPPLIPAAVPGKKYLPGDVRYKEQQSLIKAIAAAPGSSRSSSALPQNSKERAQAVREAERQREKEREKQRAMKRARQEREQDEYDRSKKIQKRMDKPGPSSSSYSSSSAMKNSDRRSYEARRMAELREQQMREKERRKKKMMNRDRDSRGGGGGSFYRGGDDYSDEEDDDEDGYGDEDDYSDMDDFIDDDDIDMDAAHRKELEDTFKIVNRRYDTNEWSRREKMISERDMHSDFRRIQTEENYSKRAGYMEDLKEASKGRSVRL